jgi:bifunctional non-homologous end joining protein LigD
MQFRGNSRRHGGSNFASVQVRYSVRFTEHLTGDGATVFEQVRRLGLEGIMSKRADTPYRSGPSKTWLKSKNPASEAVRREREEQWR